MTLLWHRLPSFACAGCLGQGVMQMLRPLVGVDMGTDGLEDILGPMGSCRYQVYVYMYI